MRAVDLRMACRHQRVELQAARPSQGAARLCANDDFLFSGPVRQGIELGDPDRHRAEHGLYRFRRYRIAPVDASVVYREVVDEEPGHPAVGVGLGRCLRRAFSSRQGCQVQGAAVLAGQEKFRRVEADLREGPCPAKQRAQLKIGEDLLDANDGLAIRRVEFETVNTKTQDKRVNSDPLESQFGVEAFSDGVDRHLLDEPWGQQEPE